MSMHEYLLGAFEQKNLSKFQEALEVFQADPNYFVEKQGKTVFEIVLSTPNSADFIKLCLEFGAEFFMKNKNNGYPLHFVIQSRCLENLKQVERLFIDTRIDSGTTHKRCSSHANVKTYNGLNSLHILAENLNNENVDTIFEMMKILISHGCNVNTPNSDIKTAFLLVLETVPSLKRKQEILQYFIHFAEFDFSIHRHKEIIELAKKLLPDFKLPEQVEPKIHFELLKKLLNENDINQFEKLFPLFKLRNEESEFYADNCAMFLEIAVDRSLINIVDMLIVYGVDVNRVAELSRFKIPPPFLAAEKSKPDILQLFLQHKDLKTVFNNDTKSTTLLHQFFYQYNKETFTRFRDIAMLEMPIDKKKCFDLLMNHPSCNRHLFNAVDEFGLSAMSLSVQFKNDYVAMQLLKKGAHIGSVIGDIRKSFLQEFLDSTITTNNRCNDDDDLEITIDYSFLWPPCKSDMPKEKRVKKTHSTTTETQVTMNPMFNEPLLAPENVDFNQEIWPLKKIAENAELQHLLCHPTIASFILLKWIRLSFLIYFNLFLISMFMATFVPFSFLCQTIPAEEQSSNVFYISFQVLSFFSLSTLIVREVMQAMFSFRRYVKKFSTWIDFLIIFSSLIILIFESDIPNHYSRVLRTLIVLLAAAEYFKLLGMVPIMSFSIYTKMFNRICLTFMKSLAFYSLLILAFAFSFYTLQGDKFARDMLEESTENPNIATNDYPDTITSDEKFNNFYTIRSSIIKSFAMMTGELETSKVNTEGFTYAALFLLFLFLITIVLYNLLNALAVSDTQEIKRDAKLIILRQRVATMCEIEKVIFEKNSKMSNLYKIIVSMFPKTLPEGKIVIKPNRGNRIFTERNKPIVHNDWLPHLFGFLKLNLRFDKDILKEIQHLSTIKREQQSVQATKKLKDSRTEKLANDVIALSKKVIDMDLFIRQSHDNPKKKLNIFDKLLIES